MTGFVAFLLIVAALVAALEYTHRRRADAFDPHAADDRDAARTKLDLLALGGRAEPFSHRPFASTDQALSLRVARQFTHHHGRAA